VAYVQADRVQETTTTTGTGTVTLAGAVTGFRTFASQMSTSDTCYYAIVDTATGAWETGIGTLASSTTLARTTLLDSSTGSAISFAAGTKQVMMTMPAEAPNFYIGTNGGQQIVIFAGAGNHGMEIGRTDGVASTPYFDFHSSSTAADYDFRMINTGTATPGTNGGGYMEWLGKLIQLTAPTGQYPALTLKSSNSSGYYPAFFNFTRTGLADVATPDNASIGTFRFDGRDAANSYANFAEIEASIGTNASGGAPAFFTFRLASSGGGIGDVMQLAGSNKSMTMVGPIIAAAATTSIPSIRLQHGTAPSSPSNGDFWTTSGGGLFGRINGNTLNYTAVYFGSSAPSSPALQPVWFNTSDGGLYIYNSSTWLEIGGSGVYSDGGDLVLADNKDLYMYSESDTPEQASGPGLTRARVGPAAVQNGDYLGYIGYLTGHDGTGLSNTAFLAAYVDGTVSSGIVPSAFKFVSTDSSGSMVDRLLLKADGSVSVRGSTGHIDLPTISTPPTPSSGEVSIFGRTIANRSFPAFIGPSGLDSALQPLLARNRVAWFSPIPGATTLTGSNGVAISATGTATAKTPATTNIHTQTAGVDFLVTTAASSAVAGFRQTVASYWTGNAAGLGGFTFVCRWAPATGVSTTTMRAFCGLTNSTSAPTDVQPSSLTNMLGMGWDAADTNIQFMRNDGSGTASKTDLGASFPVPTSDRTKVYEIAMFCAPNTTTIYYEIRDVGTGAVATGSVNSDIPSNTTLLAPKGYCSVGGTSSVIGFTLFSLYLETDI